MKFWRAVLFGILLWVLIFFEVSILIFGIGLEKGSSIYNVIHFPWLIVFIAVLTLTYFNKKGIKVDGIEGLFVGLTFVIVGAILDWIITIPLFTTAAELYTAELWWGIVLVFVLPIIIGSMKKR